MVTTEKVWRDAVEQFTKTLKVGGYTICQERVTDKTFRLGQAADGGFYNRISGARLDDGMVLMNIEFTTDDQQFTGALLVTHIPKLAEVLVEMGNGEHDAFPWFYQEMATLQP